MEMGPTGECGERTGGGAPSRTLSSTLSQVSLWSLDRSEHHDFLSCCSCSTGVPEGSIKETSINRAEHGTGSVGLLSGLCRQSKNIDKGKEKRQGGVFEPFRNPNNDVEHLLLPPSSKVTARQLREFSTTFVTLMTLDSRLWGTKTGGEESCYRGLA